MKKLIVFWLLIGQANAETNQFRIGDLVIWVTDILGFNVLDATAASYDIIWLFLILAVGYTIYRWFFK